MVVSEHLADVFTVIGVKFTPSPSCLQRPKFFGRMVCWTDAFPPRLLPI
jgi:hypothetical protein